MSQQSNPQPKTPTAPPAGTATAVPPAQQAVKLPKPGPIRAKELAEKISSKFHDVRVDYMKEKRLKVTVPTSGINSLAIYARDELGFDHISAVSGVDWIAKNEFEVVYFVGSVSKPGYEDFIISIAERFPRDNPVVPSLVDVWIGVDYQERETHEMFGINFQGHPNQSHLLLPEDWNDLPPLRKDYVSPGR